MWLKNSWEFDFPIFSPAPMPLSVLIAGAILFRHRGRELLSLEQGRNLLMSFVSNAISSAWSVHSFWVFNLPVSSLFIICSFLFSKCWPFLKEECRKRAGFLKKWVVQREVKYHKERGKKERERKKECGGEKGWKSIFDCGSGRSQEAVLQAWIKWETSPCCAYRRQILRLLH